MSNEKQELTAEQITANEELQELKITAISIGMKVGVDFHPSIGKEKLLERMDEYQEKLATEYSLKNAPKNKLPDYLPVTADEENESKSARRARKAKEANRYVRSTITCVNPDKSEWDGEYLTASNGLIGTVRKFVPFNRDEPYHVPQILVKMIQDRRYTSFTTVRGKHGVDTKKGKIVPEFNVIIHPDLTIAEHKELQRQQAIRKGDIASEL